MHYGEHKEALSLGCFNDQRSRACLKAAVPLHDFAKPAFGLQDLIEVQISEPPSGHWWCGRFTLCLKGYGSPFIASTKLEQMGPMQPLCLEKKLWHSISPSFPFLRSQMSLGSFEASMNKVFFKAIPRVARLWNHCACWLHLQSALPPTPTALPPSTGSWQSSHRG